jgi:hypothetical protein
VRRQPAPTRGALRVFRGSALAVTSATLAVAAHTLAGGMVPDTGLTVLLTIGVAAVGIAMADRRRGTAAILAVLGAAQLASHVLLSFGDEVGDMHMSAAPPVNGTVMLGAHVLAVLVSAALLAGADTAVFVVAAVLAMLLPRLLTAPPVASVPSGARRVVLAQDRCTAVLLRRSHARRGPPVTV